MDTIERGDRGWKQAKRQGEFKENSIKKKSIYEGRYFVLCCRYEIHQTRMVEIVSLVSLESFRRGGVHGLGSMVFGLAMQKFLNIEWFFHWKLN
jgi:hypothetical protein